jgi:hypothetical protein
MIIVKIINALKQMREGLSVTIFRACPAIREIVTIPPYAARIGNMLVVSDKEKRKQGLL